MDAQGGVDGHFALDHQLDGVLHLGALQSRAGKALERRQAKERARVLARVDHPAQHELVDVGHLVVARVDHVVGGREGRDVARHAHAQADGLP